MIPQPVRDYLDAHHVVYRTLAHDVRSTSQETAQTVHVSGKRFAKTVLLRTGDGGGPDFLIAVLPASEQVDIEVLAEALGKRIDLASEDDFAHMFPQFDIGAAPPLAELAADERPAVIADSCLADQSKIVFHGGSHTDLIEMRWSDFRRLASPRIVDYGRLPAWEA